jgi:hypothetical protein
LEAAVCMCMGHMYWVGVLDGMWGVLVAHILALEAVVENHLAMTAFGYLKRLK